MFSLYDLFTVGIAFEIAGAGLLVRTVLLSPRKILEENALYASPYHKTVAATRSRTESLVGFSGLALGFLVQVAAYVVYIAGGGHAAYGRERALVALLLALAAAPIWFFLGLWINRVTFRPLLRRVAQQRLRESPLPFPRADLLVHCGVAAGFDPLDGETVPKYLLRVFSVERSMLPKTGGGWQMLDEAPEVEWPKFND
jgi:hypothetical protein